MHHHEDAGHLKVIVERCVKFSKTCRSMSMI